MRLKSLELKGFKSFANETVINFNEDIIGIVGPNGSGKSNVVDAIRWVLGEQKSKELRLEKMSSVIFNGSKKRKSSGMASVALTFENTKNILPTDYQTVKITRILYRTGESEYRLNNVPCRLKDITSLFLDTGIGSNSYAIISLGMVDDLLNDKDNSRRQMFEQAAGISKYKKRKRETLNKLKSTSADLDRIEDLLFEIDNNLKSLEKQAKRTKRFYEIKQQYKDLSIDLAILKLRDIKVSQNTLKSKLETELDTYRKTEIESRQLEAQLENEKKANLDKEKALSDRQRDLNSLVGNIRGMENDKKIFEQRIQFIEENQVKLSTEIKTSRSRKTQLEEDIVRYRSQLNEEKTLEAELEKQLDEVEASLKKIKEDHNLLKTDLDDVVGKQQSLEREVFNLEKEKAIHSNQISNLQADLERNLSDITARKNEQKDLNTTFSGIEAKEKTFLAGIEKLETEETKRQEAIRKAQEKSEELQQKIVEKNRKLDALRNEYNLTKSMVDNLEGFPESIRFLSSTKDWKKDTPLLSDLIYCKEEYRVAIENYLEPYLNYYVVETIEDAKSAIQLLSKTQKGKANFFILSAFKDYVPPMVMLPETKLAIDLIETDKEYLNLCSFLLENVLVTDNEDLTSTQVENNITLLSKSGRFIQKKYSISGGSIGLFEGKRIGRKKNLEVLEVSIKKIEKEESKLSAQLYSIKADLEKLEGEITTPQIEQEKRQLNQLLQEKATIAARIENAASIISDFDEKKKNSEQSIQDLTNKVAHIDKELLAKNKAVQVVKEAIQNTDGSFRKVAEALSNASTNFNEKNINFIKQQNKVSSYQRELSFRENQLQETISKLDIALQSIGNTGTELDEFTDKIKQITAELILKYEAKKEKEASLTTAEQSYFKARGGINEIEDQLRKINRKNQDAQILINNLKDKLTDIKLQLTSVGERLNVEFGVQINEIINQEPTSKLAKEELDVKVGRLRNRLDNYGEINPMAVEAYDEMKERFDTITTQRQDILDAKATLLDTIKEIEETATEHFIKAFDQVRVYFKEVFRSLFTEDDTCDLILEDPEDPLESKIKITAKPKGKRPQSISQLSGGEKTLTATALLFSLYLLKPAPFCIFDEVDAPLDDANIDKFNKIIKKFSKDSQFIIVTHNKQTMSAVDVIYGVYMAEQGVSGVSAVDFRELDDTSKLSVAVT